MPGTKYGGLKAAKSNKERHGEDFYKKLGYKGGKAGVGPDYQKNGSKPSGFAANIERAKAAGAKGGIISRRGRKV